MTDDLNNQSQQPEAPTTETFEALIDKDPKMKAMYEQHAAGLLNTVKATRDERDGLKGQVKELLAKADKGSELESSLTETLKKLEATERRANFAEEAIKPGIECRNIKAAYALAVSLDAFDKRGNPDWTVLKKDAPELFGKPTPDAHGGHGDVPETHDINAMIRHAAGR